MNRYTAWAGAALLLPAMSLADTSDCGTRRNNTIEKLTECVTLEGVREHQAALQISGRRLRIGRRPLICGAATAGPRASRRLRLSGSAALLPPTPAMPGLQ